MITLLCPNCFETAEVQRVDFDPPDAVVARVRCPSCDDGEFNYMTYYDEGGRQILPVINADA